MSIQYFDTTDLTYKPIFSKVIHIKERVNSNLYYLDGFITYKDERKRIHRVTDKVVNKSNKLWLEKNLHKTLWELSDFYKEVEKEKVIQMIDTTPTVGEFGLKSIRMNKPHRKQTTHNKIESIFKYHIEPKFGNRKLNSFISSDMALWQSELMEKGLSAKTVKCVRSVFQTIFEDSRKDDLIKVNPFYEIKQPVSNDVYNIDPFTLDEVILILNSISEKYKPMFVLAFFSGMRWGEILGLEWSKVDFENEKIFIDQSIVMGIISTPKTESGKRNIDMLPNVKKYLQIQKEKHLNDKWVFVNQYGNHYERTDNLNNRVLKELLIKIGISVRPLRQTRHTFASMMLSRNQNILWVSYTLGHKDKTITLNTYAKYVQQTKIDRCDFLDNVDI